MSAFAFCSQYFKGDKMKKRFFSVVKRYGAILLVLVSYLIWILITDIKIPCIIYQLTSFKCPSCGITRMCLSMARFDFMSAFLYNPYLFFALPIALFCNLIGEIRYIKTGNYSLGKLKYILFLLLVGFVSFGILRNIF